MFKKYDINGSLYFRIKDIIKYLDLSKGIGDNLIKNIKTDLVLQNYIIMDFANTNGGL